MVRLRSGWAASAVIKQNEVEVAADYARWMFFAGNSFGVHSTYGSPAESSKGVAHTVNRFLVILATMRLSMRRF